MLGGLRKKPRDDPTPPAREEWDAPLTLPHEPEAAGGEDEEGTREGGEGTGGGGVGRRSMLSITLGSALKRGTDAAHAAAGAAAAAAASTTSAAAAAASTTSSAVARANEALKIDKVSAKIHHGIHSAAASAVAVTHQVSDTIQHGIQSAAATASAVTLDAAHLLHVGASNALAKDGVSDGAEGRERQWDEYGSEV